MSDVGSGLANKVSPYRWIDSSQKENIKNRIADRLHSSLSTREVGRWAPILADLWLASSELRHAIESLTESIEANDVAALILELETMRLDNAEYEKVAKRLWKELTGTAWRSKHLELKSLREILASVWRDDQTTDTLAKDIIELRSISEEAAVLLSERDLIAMARRGRPTSAITRLDKVASKIESRASNLRADLRGQTTHKKADAESGSQ